MLRKALKLVKNLLVLLGESVRVVDYQDRHFPILLLVFFGETGKDFPNVS
jgi:hypothetical protein